MSGVLLPCRNCGILVKPNLFCTNCGCRIACKNCGTTIEATANFCGNCGTPSLPPALNTLACSSQSASDNRARPAVNVRKNAPSVREDICDMDADQHDELATSKSAPGNTAASGENVRKNVPSVVEDISNIDADQHDELATSSSNTASVGADICSIDADQDYELASKNRSLKIGGKVHWKVKEAFNRVNRVHPGVFLLKGEFAQCVDCQPLACASISLMSGLGKVINNVGKHVNGNTHKSRSKKVGASSTVKLTSFFATKSVRTPESVTTAPSTEI